jgi:type II secretory pathway component GspD/PulD (secretin)
MTWLLVGTIIWLCGCSSAPPGASTAEQTQTQTLVVHTITAAQAEAILRGAGLTAVRPGSEPNVLLVSGGAAEIQKAGVILELADVNEALVAEKLAPASMVRTLPSNEQIAQSIGGIALGTFAFAPAPGAGARGIIDILGESVVAIVPARLWPDVRAAVDLGPQAMRLRGRSPRPEAPAESNLAGAAQERPAAVAAQDGALTAQMATAAGPPVPNPDLLSVPTTERGPNQQRASTDGSEQPPTPSPTAPRGAKPPREPDTAYSPGQGTAPGREPEVMRGTLKPSAKSDRPAPAINLRSAMTLPDGNDVLELSLPEKIELLQLLDLAGEYLHLDCVYDAEKIGNQMITLKLHSKLRSEMRVKDLYCLLETVLKFRGLVMSRHEGNLVTIVPAAEALEIDPQILDANSVSLQAGDVVVTRVFELQHVDVASVSSLLQGMKLSVAVSPIPETQTLFVTCYARRMERVEQLVNMIDKPGKPREFRFRQLKYTMASTLARKVLSLAGQLEGVTISLGAMQGDTAAPGPPSSRRPTATGGASTLPAAANVHVYLDADERTNRLMMIGPSEQLETVEGLIDVLDVRQQDVRVLEVYPVTHVAAESVLSKLQSLEIIGSATRVSARGAKPELSAGGTMGDAPGEEPQVVLLETTNSLLVNATREQHDQIRTVLGYIDVVPEDSRTLRVYPMRYVDAQEAIKKLQDMEVVGARAQTSARAAKITSGGPAPTVAPAAWNSGEAGFSNSPQVIVLETTNSLLVNATAPQHERIAALINHIDTEARKEALPYEVYFLENQDPDQLAQVLGKLVQETITNAEGKIEKTISKMEEPVTIIPDKNTFALIVYASRKNQEWVSGLIEKLDKRRPQVLIDVTLVEITQTEAFSYDLNLITSAPDLTQTSGLTGTIVPGQPPLTSTDIMNRLAASGRSQFADTSLPVSHPATIASVRRPGFSMHPC